MRDIFITTWFDHQTLRDFWIYIVGNPHLSAWNTKTDHGVFFSWLELPYWRWYYYPVQYPHNQYQLPPSPSRHQMAGRTGNGELLIRSPGVTQAVPAQLSRLCFWRAVLKLALLAPAHQSAPAEQVPTHGRFILPGLRVVIIRSACKASANPPSKTRATITLPSLPEHQLLWS